MRIIMLSISDLRKLICTPAGNEYQPHAQKPVPGSGDLCFIASGQVEDVISRLRLQGVEREQGPVPQTGATGAMMSVYFRDPDENLIEIACPV